MRGFFTTNLIKSARFGDLAEPAQNIVVFIAASDNRITAGTLPLVSEIIQIGLPERSVVKPVVAHPAIYHRTFRER